MSGGTERLRLTDRGWKRCVTRTQPARRWIHCIRAESEEQIAFLCETYEPGDDATREIPRTLASMSVT